MNIKQAKQEIINTVQAYLTKDETGEYAIPVERQRPVLLIGPPGIPLPRYLHRAPADGQATRSGPAVADFFHGRNLSHDTRMDKIMPKEQ